MLNAFFRDIRSIRAQENIGVHSGDSLSSNHLRGRNATLTEGLFLTQFAGGLSVDVDGDATQRTETLAAYAIPIRG